MPHQTKYNIGDMIIIPYSSKIGVIIDIRDTHYLKYEIFWQYSTGETETALVNHSTLDIWFQNGDGKFVNKLIPVPQ